jgi:hypothetical protein
MEAPYTNNRQTIELIVENGQLFARRTGFESATASRFNLYLRRRRRLPIEANPFGCVVVIVK